MVDVDSASLGKDTFFRKEQIAGSFGVSSSHLDDAWVGLFPGRRGDDRARGAWFWRLASLRSRAGPRDNAFRGTCRCGGTDMTSYLREETQLWCKTNVHTGP